MKIVKDRFTCGWKLGSVETFRLASSRLLGFYGGNAQNSSQGFARCVIPDDGNIFIQRDQRVAEAIIVAREAPRGRFIELIENNIKPHTYMALQIFTEKYAGAEAARYKGIYPKELITDNNWKSMDKSIKNSENDYALGKMTIHAKNYDMGSRTFQLNVLTRSEGAIVLTHKQAREILATHTDTFPEIIAWQSMILAELKSNNNTLRNLFGYPRYFGRLPNKEQERQAYAYKPQSTVGTITNLAFVEISEAIKKEKLPYLLLNNKHDSLLMEVPDTTEHKALGSELLKRHLSRTLISSTGENYVMETDVSFGHNWAKWHESKNPNGMKEAA